jgi:hypothetical protein
MTLLVSFSNPRIRKRLKHCIFELQNIGKSEAHFKFDFKIFIDFQETDQSKSSFVTESFENNGDIFILTVPFHDPIMPAKTKLLQCLLPSKIRFKYFNIHKFIA